ncbi:undecaprenyl-diphosphatase [Siminovitchia fortis]|uniref:Undecaprenyl-diphosphatase n=1 Tax=Siminovitchia fortis TaxID=254758 RepID=A0A443IU95_9BACI|nr:undecaprenyl-diphosphatase [Siminovitchia fortis]RWR11674.1 undecaprenyl-diphosphatase [Siminovitchia fortis]WHY83197.1 undecaprenyl-diphosphatase [Siminovitchia fortis]
MNLDYRLFELINQFAGQSHTLDQTVMLFSKFGPILFGLVFVWLWFSKSGNPVDNRKIVLYALTITVIALGINKAIELMYFRPRPFVTYAVNLLSDKANSDPSFPSNHSAGAFAITCALFWYRRRIGSALLIMAFFMALSRIYIGVHYPSDVTAGALIALIVTIVIMSQRRFLDPIYQNIILAFGKSNDTTIKRNL